MKKITKNTLKRTIRTFLQAFVGAFVSSGMIVGWTNEDIFNSLLGCLLTGLFAGLGAIGMNLEVNNEQ